MQVATVEPGNLTQAHQIARKAAGVLRQGGLVAFPTETVYGIGVCADHDQAVERLHQIKNHDDALPTFAVHLPNPQVAEHYIDLTRPSLRRLIQRVFPGPVTLAVECEPDQIELSLHHLALSPAVRDRLYRDRTIALRCPDHPLTQRILGQVGRPVIAGGAHRPDQTPSYDAADAMRAIGAKVDLVVDGGRCRYAKPSTIVRVTGTNTRIQIDVERVGVYDERFLRKLMQRTLLLICSGNTCRSPMAEVIAQQILATQQGVSIDQLENEGFKVLSAGVFAMSGAPAATHAIEAMHKQGLDLTDHRARQLTLEMINDADAIYCMTEDHRSAVLDMAPMAEKKIHRLDAAGDIDDPIGSNATTYQRTAEIIRRRLSARLAELEP